MFPEWLSYYNTVFCTIFTFCHVLQYQSKNVMLECPESECTCYSLCYIESGDTAIQGVMWQQVKQAKSWSTEPQDDSSHFFGEYILLVKVTVCHFNPAYTCLQFDVTPEEQKKKTKMKTGEQKTKLSSGIWAFSQLQSNQHADWLSPFTWGC